MKKGGQPCPCESGQDYAACCAPLHGGAAAATPEALMRSRSSAFTLALEPYLLATWHPDTRPATLDLAADGRTRWLGLSIKATRTVDACAPGPATSPTPSSATVSAASPSFRTGPPRTARKVPRIRTRRPERNRPGHARWRGRHMVLRPTSDGGCDPAGLTMTSTATVAGQEGEQR